MSNILVGADPELFVMRNGKFVSAYGLIKGDKKNPLKVDKGAVQVDGMALEFNIDPASTEDEFYVNIQTVMGILKGMVPDHEHALVPVADFSKEYIEAQPDEAKDLGCDPDFNAWSGAVNQKPDVQLPFRTASGHVHIGWTEGELPEDYGHNNMCQMAAKQMDFYLGLPSVLFDGDTRRREMYGKAGAYRPKSYGVEYRTLSNAWLKSEELIRWVFANVHKGMQELMQGNSLWEKYGDIQDIINTSDKDRAKAIISDAGIQLCGE